MKYAAVFGFIGVCLAPSALAQVQCDHRLGPHTHQKPVIMGETVSAEDVLNDRLIERELTESALSTTMMPVRQVGAAWQPIIREHTLNGGHYRWPAEQSAHR